MTARTLYLDPGPGQTRGAVFLNGAPERLLVERVGEDAEMGAGAEYVARVRAVDRALALAFLDLGSGREAALAFGPGGGPAPQEGARLKVRLASPPRRGKAALASPAGLGEGEPRLLAPAPPLLARLQAFAPEARIIAGRDARQAADIAEEAALTAEHGLPCGGRIIVEQTRALTSVDIDAGALAGDPARGRRRLNLEAVLEGARVLRLKGLGGLVVFDLVGRGHDGAAISAAADAAFRPEGDGVVIGRISRLGLFEVALPRRQRPISEVFLGDDGQESITTIALRLLRDIEDAAAPGRLVTARAPPAVAQRALELSPALRARIGARFVIEAQPGAAPSDISVVAP